MIDPTVEVVWDGRGPLLPEAPDYPRQRCHPLVDAGHRWGWLDDRSPHARPQPQADRLGQAKAHQGPTGAPCHTTTTSR